MVSNKANDDLVVKIQKIFDNIKNFNYEEAFFLSCEIMERNENGDQLFHEWVKSLVEFYSCNKRDNAIKFLEKIRPTKLENEIHFRIVNSLMCFYREIGNKKDFIKYKKIIYSYIDKVENVELKHKIIYNIANGFYTFKDYEKALEYSDESIAIGREKGIFNMDFSLSIMVKIMSLFYLGKHKEGHELKEMLINYLEVTGNINHKSYLEKALERFYEKEGCKGEKCT